MKDVFNLLGESISDDEVNSNIYIYFAIHNFSFIAMIKIAGVKSNDKINFKEFVDFFYKIDWSKKGKKKDDVFLLLIEDVIF